MDLLQLKMFLSVSHTLNFTRTAAEFFMSQPTVSNQIRALENELGVALLNRSSHHVSLTEAGSEYVGYATKILETQAAAELRLRNLSDNRPGYIRIAMLSSSAMFFSEVLKSYSQEYPQVHVDVTMMEGAEMLRALRQLDHDLYFTNESMMPGHSESLTYMVTERFRLHLFVHKKDYPSIDLNDWSTIEKLPFVSMPASDFTLVSQIDQLCQKRGIRHEIINYYNRADMLLLSVNSGTGIAILPPNVSPFCSPPDIVSIPIPGDDACVNAVVAWKVPSDNAEADNCRRVAAEISGMTEKEREDDREQ